MKSFLQSKLFKWLVAAVIVLIVFVVLFFTVSEYAHFKRVQDEALSVAGEIGTGSNYFKIDTKASAVPFSDMTSVQFSIHSRMQAQAIEAIKSTNTELGFDDSLYAAMSATTEQMGTQSVENDCYIVSWSYCYDDGLEVKYQLKSSAMFKFGGN